MKSTKDQDKYRVELPSMAPPHSNNTPPSIEKLGWLVD